MRLSNYRALFALCAFLAVSLSACSPASVVRDIGYTFDPLPRVAFGPEDGIQDDVALGLPPYESYWKPSPHQIRQVERALAARTPVWRYGVQFVGVVEGGRDLIIANGIRGDRDIESGWIIWFHGGEFFFRAAYDVDEGELLYFWYGDNLG
ncbi:MAG: hypothetical protein ABJF88_19095 [Rhodothermales bacterium]